MGTFVRYATTPVITEFVEDVVSGLEDPIDRSIAREFQESTLAGPIARRGRRPDERKEDATAAPISATLAEPEARLWTRSVVVGAPAGSVG